ncbi:MAG: hypothetical protein AAF567_18495 [Actinomycetota bacterium]
MVKALVSFAAACVAGVLTATAAWITSLVIVSDDQIYVIQGREASWGVVLGVVTAVFAVGAMVFVTRKIEPVMMAIAAAATAVMLHRVPEFPFGGRSTFGQTDERYWTVVAIMIAIFTALLVSLRASRMRSERR